jgi:hypothetical protein
MRLSIFRRMVSSGMLRRVALVRTDVSEELSASFIRVTRICELAVTSNRRTLRRNTTDYVTSLYINSADQRRSLGLFRSLAECSNALRAAFFSLGKYC